ncbi:MAG: aromatic acid decarboxylase [Spirochaetae bacterium HGW-Spirochaetae-9]|nr:MAG: aromatic acid decarboxylase [Spirochaetae bacterium HGW-Spirochaetae-9]
MERYLVCITGASGALYSLRLISALAAKGVIVHLTCSSWGARVILEETERPLGYWLGKIRTSGGPDGSPALVKFHSSDDFSSPIASGSFRLAGTVIVPCSMGTLGSLASGACSNLIHRAGSVALKEGWPLILVPRETPLSLVSLKAFVSLKEAGAVILPASPSFYSKPTSIEQLADTVVNRIMDRLGVPDERAYRWNEGP